MGRAEAPASGSPPGGGSMVTNSESCFAWFVFLLALCVCLGIGRWNRRGVPRADRTESERGYVGLLLPPPRAYRAGGLSLDARCYYGARARCPRVRPFRRVSVVAAHLRLGVGPWPRRCLRAIRPGLKKPRHVPNPEAGCGRKPERSPEALDVRSHGARRPGRRTLPTLLTLASTPDRTDERPRHATQVATQNRTT